MHISRGLSMAATAVMVLGLSASGFSTSPALADGKTDKFGPFASSSTDNGSCGQPWATDTAERTYTVHDNGDGTFRVNEQYKDGTFTTIGGVSPGACETDKHHGSTVNPGVTGKFTGFLRGTVTSSTYNPDACTAVTCTYTSDFIATVFGPSATFTCFQGFEGCDFNFEYSSNDKSLKYHHWQDKSDNHDGEKFEGDIANS